MEKVAQIYLIGPVGIFEGENGPEGFTINSVISQVQAYRDQGITRYNFRMRGPGGYVDEGNEIFSYMRSLVSDGVSISTEQVGDIGSIMTKLFLAPLDSKDRFVREEFNFMIHNPWGRMEGDATEFKEYAEDLEKIEKELRAFYKESTGITEEGLKPLMDKESRMTAKEAIALGFAGGYAKASTQNKVLAYFKPKTDEVMSNEKTLITKIKNLLNVAKEESPKAIDLTLESGATLRLDAETEEELIGSNAMLVDADGNESAAPEGTHVLNDGRSVTVNASGIVEAINEPSEEPEENEEMAKLKDELKKAKDKIEAYEKEREDKIEKAVSEGLKEVSQEMEKVEKEVEALAKDREQLKAMRKIYAIDVNRDFVKELDENSKPTAYDKGKEEISNKKDDHFKRGHVVDRKKAHQ